MRHYIGFVGSLFLFVFSCKSPVKKKENNIKISEVVNATIEVQGHRGERGHYPENSIEGFLSAIKKGVDVIEMDVVISKDKKVVVSHEPFMASLYMLTPDGDSIPKREEKRFNLYEMTYDSIRKFDAGSKGNRLFPQQQKQATYKPLLSEVIDRVEAFISTENEKSIRYNIELKSHPDEYEKTQPTPDKFIDLVMQVITKKGVSEKCIVQSFDPEILNTIHQKHPEITLSYLVSKPGIDKNLALLNFHPKTYSPNYKLVKNKTFVDSVKRKEMRLVPWTVNDEKVIKKMIVLKVDGIITDYPERVLQLL